MGGDSEVKLGEPTNFGHRPNMGGGVSGAAKPFIKKRYGHVLRGEPPGSVPGSWLGTLFSDFWTSWFLVRYQLWTSRFLVRYLVDLVSVTL